VQLLETVLIAAACAVSAGWMSWTASAKAVEIALGPGAASLDAGILAEEPEVVDLNELIRIDYKEGQPLPESVTRLDGKRISVKGFMSTDTKEQVSEFSLVSDSCGCSGQVKVHHFVEVDLGDKKTGYRPEMITLVGTISVGEERDADGYVVSVFRLTAESIL